ncbi:MAG TPA: type II secretion system F family protein, partial [Roseiflexaceae bacterium]|nr:type II secretion system F family protein [Roseiflexaceae bacterium]
MPTFAYSARSTNGELLSGEIDLPSRDEVVGYLVRQRLRPVSVNAKARDINITFGTGIKTREVVIFTRQFATMINSGLPLVQSLTILAEQTENKNFRKIIQAVLQDIQAGQTLADSMRKHPKVFTELYVN